MAFGVTPYLISRIGQSTRFNDPTLPKEVLGSKQFATFVEVLGEGEIEGFPSAAAYTKGTNNYNLAASISFFFLLRLLNQRKTLR